MGTPPDSPKNDSPFPPTGTSLMRDLRAVGVASGMVLIVHSSLRAIARRSSAVPPKGARTDGV